VSDAELADARQMQTRLRLSGGQYELERVLVDFGFLTRRQLDDALAVTGGVTPPGDELPLDVVEAQHKPDAKFGHFLLLNEIGRGGLGVVHRAWDTEIRRILALKFLRSEASMDPGRIVDLLQEGSRLSRLRHPNIITVHEFGRIRNQFYIAMDLLEGMGLDQLVRSAKARNQLSPFYDQPKRYLAIFRDIARAVHYTHTRTPPLIHCDLKPQNIFIDLSWKPYLVDFGVAREMERDPSSSGVSIAGSPAYMAPEQVLGQTGDIDARTDVYGLGAILYELLTGRPPIVAESVQEALDKNLLIDPPPPSKVVAARVAISTSASAKPSVPAELEAICMKCIAKERKDRFQSAREVAEAIDPLVGDKPLRVRIESAPTVRAAAPAQEREARQATVRRLVQKSLRRASLVGFVLGVVLIGIVAVIASRFAWIPKGDPRKTVGEKMDGLAARLDIEDAQTGYKEHADQTNDRDTNEWVMLRMEDLEALRQFREHLAMILARERPEMTSLALRDGALANVVIVGASSNHVEVVAGTQRQIPWRDIAPHQIAQLAMQWSADFKDRPRLGLAIFAIKNRLWPEAKSALSGLEGPMAARYLKEIPAGE